MVKNPFIIMGILLGIESVVLWVSTQERFKKYFQFLPGVFWIYFLPILGSTLGIIDPESPVYDLITTHLLPASLLLLLVPVDVQAISRLGRPALLMMLSGSAGMMLGTVISFKIFSPFIGQEFWSGFGALSASWTGGSANMIAVRSALGTPDAIYLPMVIVDTVVPYVWMGILVAAVSFENGFDRFTRADRRIIDDIKNKIDEARDAPEPSLKFFPAVTLILFAVGGSQLARLVSRQCPEIPNVLSAYGWTIVFVSILGLGLSFTSARKLAGGGANRIGYFLLYFVLTAIGAKASLNNVGSTFILILAGFVIVGVHVIVLVVTARRLRVPLFLAAVASQANIGGVASAPVVAEIYRPGFASVGLLLAILGNVMGTYLGILTAQLCRMTINY